MICLYFNPRTPCGVRLCKTSGHRRSAYFNPRTPCGVRPAAARGRPAAPAYFNPRAPCGARHQPPLTASFTASFQSTRPLRGATPAKQCRLFSGRFQSTRPLRGATIYKLHVGIVRVISIHAPLAGRDRSDRRVYHAVRGRISIHAPLAGRDYSPKLSETPPPISIHAPLAGRDQWWTMQIWHRL